MLRINYLDNITSKESLIREHVTRKKIINEFVLKQQKELSQKELLLKICNTTFNKKWANGKIYSYVENGVNISHSVSPYSETFLENIEEKIKDLIIALKNKNYFTISSCQGHDLHDRRFITLIFPSKELALEFKQKIPFKLAYKVKHVSDFLNMEVMSNSNGNILNIKKIDTNSNFLDLREKNLKHQNDMEYINCFLRRNYSDAWFLELIISESIPDIKNILLFFKYLPQFIFKIFFMNIITNKLTNYINSEKFEKNIY
jgi:hypothetical protein